MFSAMPEKMSAIMLRSAKPRTAIRTPEVATSPVTGWPSTQARMPSAATP